VGSIVNFTPQVNRQLCGSRSPAPVSIPSQPVWQRRQDILSTHRAPKLRLSVGLIALGRVVSVLAAVVLREAHEAREQDQSAEHGVEPNGGALRGEQKETI
jgi:hypothetical protein